MKRHLTIAAIAIAAHFAAFAQHEIPDTLTINNPYQPISPLSPISPELSKPVVDSLQIAPTLNTYQEKYDEYRDSIGAHDMPNIYYPKNYPGNATMLRWYNGALVAAGRTDVFPGLMNMESAILNFHQQLGRFTLTAYGSATKIGYFRGLSTQWGYGGSLSYQISDNVSVTGFGSYATRSRITQPAMLGFIDYPNFGGFVDYHFGESHWGVKAGAQSYYSLGSRHWDTQPILMPYYRTSSGVDLGIDVGGILYNILENCINKGNNNYGGGGNNFSPQQSKIPPLRKSGY